VPKKWAASEHETKHKGETARLFASILIGPKSWQHLGFDDNCREQAIALKILNAL
jgi:hypothetical protein